LAHRGPDCEMNRSGEMPYVRCCVEILVGIEALLSTLRAGWEWKT
jgi:hypothetical protein